MSDSMRKGLGEQAQEKSEHHRRRYYSTDADTTSSHS